MSLLTFVYIHVDLYLMIAFVKTWSLFMLDIYQIKTVYILCTCVVGLQHEECEMLMFSKYHDQRWQTSFIHISQLRHNSKYDMIRDDRYHSYIYHSWDITVNMTSNDLRSETSCIHIGTRILRDNKNMDGIMELSFYHQNQWIKWNHRKCLFYHGIIWILLWLPPCLLS